MDIVKEKIDLEEKRLYFFMENKIIECLRNFCQWRLHNILREKIIEDELKKINNLLPDLLMKISLCAPYHYQNLPSRDGHPLEAILRPSYLFHQYEMQAYEFNRENQNGGWYWVLITYSQMDNEGFSRNFSKRVIENLVENNILRRKRAMPGFLYSFVDFTDIRDRINYTKNGILIAQDKFSVINSENWIYDKFPDEEIEDLFENIKEDVFSRIINGKD